jgi:hypothetical protein
MRHVVQLMYLMLPAYLANMTPPFARYWTGWNHPFSRRWLGAHKTVVGFCAGGVVAVAVTFMQSAVNWHQGLLPLCPESDEVPPRINAMHNSSVQSVSGVLIVE